VNPLRLAITLLFCLLQVLSPLLHAHVGEDCSPTAVHLPGLENGGSLGDGHRAAPIDGMLICAAKGVRPGTPVLSPAPQAAPTHADLPIPRPVLVPAAAPVPFSLPGHPPTRRPPGRAPPARI